MFFLFFTCCHTLKALNSSYLGTVIKLTFAFLSSYIKEVILIYKINKAYLLLFSQKPFNKKRVYISFWWKIITQKIVSKRKYLKGITSKIKYLKKLSFGLEYVLQFFRTYLINPIFFLLSAFSVFSKFFLILLRLFTLLLRVKVNLVVDSFFFFIWFKVVPLKSSFLFLTFLHFTNFRVIF